MKRHLSYRLYVCAHKNSHVKLGKDEVLIVGGASTQDKSSYPSNVIFDDDDEDNISYKNKHYCELTQIYYVWKHAKEDIIGVEHYRRFFYFPVFGKHILYPSKKRVVQALKKSDIIMLRPTDYFGFRPFKEIIVNVFPDSKKYFLIIFDYLIRKDSRNEAIIDDYLNSNTFHICNMHIAKRQIINDYYQWIFDICTYIEKIIDEKFDYNKNLRIYGWFSEYLFDLWIMINNYKVFEIGVRPKRFRLLDFLK